MPGVLSMTTCVLFSFVKIQISVSRRGSELTVKGLVVLTIYQCQSCQDISAGQRFCIMVSFDSLYHGRIKPN